MLGLGYIGRMDDLATFDKPLGAFGFVVCVLFLFCGVFADVLAPYGFNQISPVNRLKPPSAKFFRAGGLDDDKNLRPDIADVEAQGAGSFGCSFRTAS